VLQSNTAKTKMEATAMNDLLQQLHKIVPSFDVASIPKDATGAYASPVHIIAGLIDVTPVYIQKIINDICANVNANCSKMKVTVNGTEKRNRIMVGNAESILRMLASCSHEKMPAIVAKLPVVVPVLQASAAKPALQAPGVAPALQAPGVTPAPQAPAVNVPVQPSPLVAPIHQAPFVNVPAQPLPLVAPAPQAPAAELALQAPGVAPAPQAPAVAMDVDGASADFLQDNDDMTIQDHFDFIPAQIVEFELKLTDGSDFVVPVRRDGYVNVTKICQAAGKRLDFYFKTDHAKESMDFLQKNAG